MSRSENQKLKLLHLLRMLQEHTDEEHGLTVRAMIDRLNRLGIKAERKSIYDDIKALENFGLVIAKRRTTNVAYHLIEREFELAELKLLVDAVQSSRLITEKKSRQLIRKLSSLTSRHQAKELKRQVHVADRPKTLNESVYYSIDAIHAATGQNRKISFKYFDYDMNKRRKYRKKGERYLETPLSLCWADDNYYLICFNTKHDSLIHYRVDRMAKVEIRDEPRDRYDRDRLNIAEHVKQSFGMFRGIIVKATLEFDADLVNAVMDRFGKNVILQKTGERFQIHVNVTQSPVFLSWMFQFGDKAQIREPEGLREAMARLIQTNLDNYS